MLSSPNKGDIIKMSKRVYISADYDINNGDRDVVDQLVKWGLDNLHKVDYVEMSTPSLGSVSNSSDCRMCDLKAEFNRQINASSAVIFVVGRKTAVRIAGNSCQRALKSRYQCFCTPYKQNINGPKPCKIYSTVTNYNNDFFHINNKSYLQHEFEQAKKKNKKIIIVYNSTRKETSWLPSYMYGYEHIARPFWKISPLGYKIGDYQYIKEELGF